MKIYLGGPMFSASEVEYNLRLASKIRTLSIEVYCPNENLAINDKTRGDLTGEKIYLADIVQLKSSNIFLCQVVEDSGTMWEAGYMDCLSRHVDPRRYLGSIGLATDIRLKTLPDPKKAGVDNQTFYLNQFVVGGLKLSLGIFQTETALFERLSFLRENHHDQ
jgi:nucleoside 2-deoxyribosyltransferase-like protein